MPQVMETAERVAAASGRSGSPPSSVMSGEKLGLRSYRSDHSVCASKYI